MATGLAFSVPEGSTLPPSLRKILLARQKDLGLLPTANGSLEQWARNGVLLLNTALTVRRGQANSHRSCWQPFTDAVIKAIGARAWPIAFMLWGRQAQESGERNAIPDRHVVVKTLHPAARSHPTERPFVDSRPFKQADDGLRARDQPIIGWWLPGDP